MRKFIVKLSYFVTPLLILLLILFPIIESLFRAIPNDYSYKNNYLTSNNDDIEVLVLGSSHAYYGINPEYITKYNSFNLSHISQSINIDLLLLQKYNFKKLNTLILPISYFTFWFDLEQGSESFRIKNYLNYYNLPIRERKITDFELLNSEVNNTIQILYDYYINPKKKHLKNVNEKGFGQNYKNSGSIKTLNSSGISASKRHSFSGRENRIDTNIRILEQLIGICKTRKINVILLTTPTYQSYFNNLNAIQLSQVFNNCDLMVKKYSNCKYINQLEDQRFQLEDFRDADHLSFKGAEKLSKIINDNLK